MILKGAGPFVLMEMVIFLAILAVGLVYAWGSAIWSGSSSQRVGNKRSELRRRKHGVVEWVAWLLRTNC